MESLQDIPASVFPSRLGVFDEDSAPRVEILGPWKDYSTAIMRERIRRPRGLF